MEVGFIPNPVFRELDADEAWRNELSSDAPSLVDAPVHHRQRSSQLPAHLERMCSTPLLSAEQERDLFQRMNYLKYRANAIRATLDEKRPSAKKLREFDLLLSRATDIRNLIAQSNVRLVVSIVRKFANDQNPFDDLLSDGISCLINTIEKFDFGRGFRFSTYATMAIRREVFRMINRAHRDRLRFATGADPVLDQQEERETPEERTELSLRLINSELSQALAYLDDREQFIVKARFGIIDIEAKPTFSRLGRETRRFQGTRPTIGASGNE